MHLSYCKGKVLLRPSFSQSSCGMGNEVRGSIVSSKSTESNKKIFSAIKDNLVYRKSMNSVSANWPCETSLLMLLQVSCNMQNSIIITVENWHKPFRIKYWEQQVKYHLPNMINSKYYSKEVSLNLLCGAHRGSCQSLLSSVPFPLSLCGLLAKIKCSISWSLDASSLWGLYPALAAGWAQRPPSSFPSVTTIIPALEESWQLWGARSPLTCLVTAEMRWPELLLFQKAGGPSLFGMGVFAVWLVGLVLLYRMPENKTKKTTPHLSITGEFFFFS